MSDVYELPKKYFAYLSGSDTINLVEWEEGKSYKDWIFEGSFRTDVFEAHDEAEAKKIGYKLLEERMIPF